MFEASFRALLRVHGQTAEIRRQGRVVTTAKVVIAAQKSGANRLSIPLDIDVQAGDEVFCIPSQKTFQIERVEAAVENDKPVWWFAYYSTGPNPSQVPAVVYGSYFHNSGTIQNSGLQIASPNASQSITVTIELKDKAQDVIRKVLELVDQLNLSLDDKEALRAEAEATQAILKSPKTKWDQVKDFLTGIRDKVKEGIATKVAEAVVTSGQAAVLAITELLGHS